MKARFFAVSLLAASAPLQGASISDRVTHLESQLQQMQIALNKLNQRSESSTPVKQSTSRSTYGHQVRSGESFWSIAKEHKISISMLQNANPGIDPRRLAVGKTLKIPGGTNSSSIPTHSQTPISGGSTYTVRNGDILGRISEAHGIRLHELMTANPGLDPRRLKVGTILNIPGHAKTPKQASSQTYAVATKTTTVQQKEIKPCPVEHATAPKPAVESNPYLASRQQEARRITRNYSQSNTSEPRLVKISRDSRFTEIANRYRTTVANLNNLNDVDLSGQQMIRSGSLLYVPGR